MAEQSEAKTEAQVPDLPRTPDGHVDFGVLFSEPEIEDALWRDAVPLWSVVKKPQPTSPH